MMEKCGVRALRTSPAAHGSPDGPEGGPRRTFGGIRGAPGKVLGTILNEKSFSQDRSRCRGASLELNDEAGVHADPQTTTSSNFWMKSANHNEFELWKECKDSGTSRVRSHTVSTSTVGPLRRLSSRRGS